MEGFENEIKREFISEALAILYEAESSFMELEESLDPKPLLDRIFRLAHNLKGSSHAVGFTQVSEFTHQLESLVLKLQRDELGLVAPVITTLLRSNDRLVEMLTKLKTDFSAKFDNSEMLTEIQNWLDGKFTVKTVPSAAPRIVKSAPVNNGQGIRVSLERIDQVNSTVQELIEIQTLVRQQIASGARKGLNVSLRKLTKLTKNLQGLTKSMRMTSVKPLVQKLQRVVRDTATMLNKNVDLEVEGESMEMDKSVLDDLADPLIHILRNSVDHGLEASETRMVAGKHPIGSIKLLFKHEGTDLVVEVRDDGRGINCKILRRRAIEMKLISKHQPITDDELIEFIFHPGFTTKSEISEISGRGVGMDVVKNHVEQLGGTVNVTTVVGRSSMIRLTIPLSPAGTAVSGKQKAAA